MRTIKQIDFYLQLTVIIGGILFIPFIKGLSYFSLYFILGAIQVISFLSHLLAGPQVGLTPGRRIYGWLLLITTAIIFLSIPLGGRIGLSLVMGFLLFLSPIIAFLYCRMCYQELQLIHHESK